MSGQKRVRTKATVQRKLATRRKSNDRSKSRDKSNAVSDDAAMRLPEGRLSDRLHSLAHQPKSRDSVSMVRAASSGRNGSSLHADNSVAHGSGALGAELSPFDSIASSVIALMVLAARPEVAHSARHQNTVVAKAALARLISTRFSDDD